MRVQPRATARSRLACASEVRRFTDQRHAELDPTPAARRGCDAESPPTLGMRCDVRHPLAFPVGVGDAQSLCRRLRRRRSFTVPAVNAQANSPALECFAALHSALLHREEQVPPHRQIKRHRRRSGSVQPAADRRRRRTAARAYMRAKSAACRVASSPPTRLHPSHATGRAPSRTLHRSASAAPSPPAVPFARLR